MRDNARNTLHTSVGYCNRGGYTKLTLTVYSDMLVRMRNIVSDGVNHKECVMVRVGGNAEGP